MGMFSELATRIGSLFVIAIFFVPLALFAKFFKWESQRSHLNKWQRAAVESGLVDRHEGYWNFLTEYKTRARKLSWQMALGFLVVWCVVDIILGSEWVKMAMFTMPFVLFAQFLVMARAHRDGMKEFKDTRSASADRRFVPPRPASPQVDASHGSARHAADQELQAKGFAEREP